MKNVIQSPLRRLLVKALLVLPLGAIVLRHANGSPDHPDGEDIVELDGWILKRKDLA